MKVENNSQETSSNFVLQIKHKTLYELSGFLILVILVIMFFNSKPGFAKLEGDVIQEFNNSDVQLVKLRVEGGNYIMEPSTLKVGVPVRVEADINKMPGCSKSVVISAFNIRKNLYDGDNFIEFVPDKAGKFNILCSMNMYKGTFTVLDSSGKSSDYIEQASTGGHSCGANGGGCGGCGGF